MILFSLKMFEVEIPESSISEEVFQYLSHIPVQLVVNAKEAQKTSIPSILELYDYHFHRSLRERIFFNVFPTKQNAFQPTTTILHHSILISSPPGSGKTVFLLKLLETIKSHDKGVISQYCDLSTIAKETDSILSIQGNLSSIPSFQMNAEENFEQSLSFLFEQVFHCSVVDYCSSMKSEKESTEIIVLFLDNIDVLFQPFLNDHDPNSSSPELPYYLDHYYRLIAYHLQVITSYLRDQECSPFKIFLVGSTSIPQNRIPKSSVGCFEMEAIYSLPKPSFQDRCYLCYEHLSRLFSKKMISFENLVEQSPLWMKEEMEGIFSFLSQSPVAVNPSSETVINRCCWAYRLAGLTQGYLPGDIDYFLKKLFSLQPWTTRTSQSQSDVALETPNLLTWESLTDCLSKTSVKAIEDLEIVHQYDDSSSLSWDSFIGYEETIQQIQRLLNPLMKPERSAPSSSSSLIEKYRFPRGLVLYGPSGCGKTFLAKIISKQVRCITLP